MQSLMTTPQARYSPMQSAAAPQDNSSALRLCCSVLAAAGVVGCVLALGAPATTATELVISRQPTMTRPMTVIPGATAPTLGVDRAPSAVRSSADDVTRYAVPQPTPEYPTSPSTGVSSLAYDAVRFLMLPFAVGALAARFMTRPSPAQWQMAATAGAESEEVLDVEAVESDPEISPIEEVVTELEAGLCCPTCMKPLNGPMCYSCALEYEDTGVYLNLTPASGKPLNTGWDAAPVEEESPFMQLPFVKEALPTLERLEKAIPPPAGAPSLTKILKGGYGGDKGAWGTTTFENPLVSGVYEKGWRQSFARAGFPGPDKEFEMALDWLLPTCEGKAILDASCGSGLFTRRFISSGKFNKVYALDFSESMLLETRSGIDNDTTLTSAETPVELVRADIARLPFASESLDGIHAGAAIHCWPQPSLAMAEIARTLKPGARVVLSTFLVPGQDISVLNEASRAALVNPLVSQGMKYWEETELRALCAGVGLVDWQADRKQDYIMFSVKKAEAGL